MSFHLHDFIYVYISSIERQRTSVAKRINAVVHVVHAAIHPVHTVIVGVVVNVTGKGVRAVSNLAISAATGNVPMGVVILGRVVAVTIRVVAVNDKDPTGAVIQTVERTIPIPVVAEVDAVEAGLAEGIQVKVGANVAVKAGNLAEVTQVTTGMQIANKT